MKVVHLTNGLLSVVLCEDVSGTMAWQYFGSALGELNTQQQMQTARALSPAVPQAFLDDAIPCALVPTGSEGVLSRPALVVANANEWLPHLQVVRVEQESALSCRIVQRASAPALELVTELTLDAEQPVLTQQHHLTNTGAQALEVRVLETTLPVPAHLQEMLHFTGRWCQEFTPQRQPVQVNTYSWENRKGRASHDHFPGLVLGTPAFSEERGEVLALHLAWSGNHQQHLVVDTFQPTRYQAGMGLQPLEMTLNPDESHASARLYAAYSETGLNGIRSAFHSHVREHILRFPQPEKPRPVHLNTWEAVYFQHDTDDLKALANAAHDIGIERFILDDGWFRGRRDDKAGLGDWTVDAAMYPQGLLPLARHVTDLGMEFGIWFEPEMVNPDSDLYRAHPEWVLQLPERQQPLGRYQMVLDLTRAEVQNYLFEHLDAILTALPVSYVKWDMNRDLVQAGDAHGLPAYERQVQALYDLLARVCTAHPSVEIESCASGGARIDFAILAHTQRFWTSDCNDPLERQMIQWGFGLFLPPEVMGAHIGPAHSLTTGRDTSQMYRALTAMFGHFGVEADVRLLSVAERQQLAEWIALHKTRRADFHCGRSRVWDHPDQGVKVTGVITNDQQRAHVVVAQQTMPARAVSAPVRISGLLPQQHYVVRPVCLPNVTNHLMKTLPSWLEGTTVLTGKQLAHHGLAMPVLDPASAFMFELIATEEQ